MKTWQLYDNQISEIAHPKSFLRWVNSSGIDIQEYANSRWVAVAYDQEKEVIEYAWGSSLKSAVENLCRDLPMESYWDIYEPQISDLLRIWTIRFITKLKSWMKGIMQFKK